MMVMHCDDCGEVITEDIAWSIFDSERDRWLDICVGCHAKRSKP